MFACPQTVSLFFNSCKVSLREPSGIGCSRIDIKAFFLSQVFHAKGGIKSSAESQH